MKDILELDVERAIAGGRMLARHEGRIVFLAGAIPGERVRARVTRAGRQGIWADTVDVIRVSPDRREPPCDPACGGLAFAHIRYDRQLALKGQILADAFHRLARTDIGTPIVQGSPEAGYRLRARLHVRDGGVGFFREGTHVLCDAGATRQLSAAAMSAVEAAVRALRSRVADCDTIVVSENVAATERVLHLEARPGTRLDDLGAAAAALVTRQEANVSGVTALARGGLATLAGSAHVTDSGSDLLGVEATAYASARWIRRPTSFFQGNRFLTGPLVRRVLDLAPGERIADLYAGVGLFTVALAARGSRVIAVEGDSSSTEDLEANARPWTSLVRVVRGAVEEFLRRPPSPAPDVVVVDPPRTGMSADALDHLSAWGMPVVVYVSCDPPTLARDAARLAERGLRLLSLEGFDLFPNTPHVEAIATFARP